MPKINKSTIAVQTICAVLIAVLANFAFAVHEESIEIPALVQEFKCDDTWHISYVNEFTKPEELCKQVLRR